ncbi:putative lipoprotein [Bifidobacterium actinocoloniiforme DSM 22766]|uniref:Putative lipoprotein n=1 Tax=Bifidobacterium actinocoloniiforme DSM 22766 TaxID=1437605 RepID=A0A086YVT0_9BIFI|nr:hypothetical protein [Bifidobacterium actinocoloniiforme]AKV54962.1 hypothetical protein AB656_00210 [Bifidobacterium actinocoloniiforme DSM 22766]KFI38380.1 putative lipoprotein [Bifidobacterium actinocoloniiforme DSM 22766]
MIRPSRKQWASKALAAVLSGAALVGLTACEGQVPKPSAQDTASSSATPMPDLTTEQEAKIRGTIIETLNKANEAKDPTGLDARVTGPQLEIRSSELSIAKATGKLDPKTTIPSKIAQTVIPGDTGWPRSVFAITTTTEDQQSKRLLVMDQQSARQNYKLWGVARLFQGAQLPKFPVPTIGAQMGAADDKSLKQTPAQAVDHYADLLQHGKDSKHAQEFSSDYLRESIDKLTQTVQQGIDANKGEQEQVFQPVQGQIRVMRSSDGGDLVVAQIDSVWTRKAGEGRESLPASDAEKALFGGGKATSTMKVTYVNVVALYVPPSSSSEPIKAVGAERQPIKVEAI